MTKNLKLIKTKKQEKQTNYYKVEFYMIHTNNKDYAKITKLLKISILYDHTIKYANNQIRSILHHSEILRLLYDLRKSPLIAGFKIAIAGRLSTERAAYMLRNKGILTFATKRLYIDYTATHKIMRFGLVGIKAWINPRKSKANHYALTFICSKKVKKKLFKKMIYLRNKLYSFTFRGNFSVLGEKDLFLKNYLKREYASWAAGVRDIALKTAQKPDLNNLPIHPIYNYIIMPVFDFSFKKHFLLIDFDFLDDAYYKVYGTFTTSQSPFNNKKPELVSNITIKGQNKNQYCHLFEEPRLILKSAVDFSTVQNLTEVFARPDYACFLEKVRKQFDLP